MMILEVMHEVLFLMHGVTAKVIKILDKNMKCGICKPDRTMALQTFYYNNKKKERKKSLLDCLCVIGINLA